MTELDYSNRKDRPAIDAQARPPADWKPCANEHRWQRMNWNVIQYGCKDCGVVVVWNGTIQK